ncbi:MAG TPA: aminotransferase class V-fold PLP-dependent enzyme, partial [Longimicrobium sp.]|nr:aminotransferase class V-fold PLP-dependent enzyme [Longimicrobium sp.]
MQASTPSAATPLDVAALRESEFPHVGRAPYLNAASVGPLPERARRAVEAAVFRRSSVHDLRGDDFEPTLERARAAAARLIGAEPDEIALQPNTTYGINLAAHVLPVERGQRIVVSGQEFPANVYPWMRLERDGRARVTVVPADALGRPDEARIREELDRGDVAVFALSSVQFATGWNADLADWGRYCAERGIFFVVDAIQSLGQVPTDVRAAGVDILAAGGQKWLCSPWGTGFAYVRRELVQRVEPDVVGWTAMRSAADLTDQCGYAYDLLESARRFEVSTQPWHDFAGFTRAVELLLEVGVERIRAHVLGLLDPLVDWLRETGAGDIVSDLDPARRSGVFAFRPAGPAAAFRALHRAGIVCTLREGSVRLSPHLYNTPDDVRAVIDLMA